MLRATALLSIAVLIAFAATACGSSRKGSEHVSSAGAPKPSDLAADAVAALEAKGSAHYELDVNVKTVPDAAPIVFHVTGDASRTKQTGDLRFSFGTGELGARILVGEHDFFVQFMGRWYGTHKGLADARKSARARNAPAFTPAWVRAHFDDVFTGTVGAGPVLDGRSTWKYTGRLNADGFARLTEQYAKERVSAADRERLHRLAKRVRFTLVADRDDGLPRRVELDVKGSDFHHPFEGSQYADLAVDAHGSLILSNFGETVAYKPPARFEPVEKLLDQLFQGLE